jgi:hypothetical protein
MLEVPANLAPRTNIWVFNTDKQEWVLFGTITVRKADELVAWFERQDIPAAAQEEKPCLTV